MTRLAAGTVEEMPAVADRDLKPENVTPRFTAGQVVEVTLRHSETGRRGEVRRYEQVRVGTIAEWSAATPPDAAHVFVNVPGWGRRYVPIGDVRDAGVGVRGG